MPFDGEARLTNVKVACPCARYNAFNMSVTIMYSETSDLWIPLPINGCDNGNCGANTCAKCSFAVMKLFIEDPLQTPRELLYPII